MNASDALIKQMSVSTCSNQITSSSMSSLKPSNSMTRLSMVNNVFNDDPFIVHPGAISSILHLLPTVPTNEDDHVS